MPFDSGVRLGVYEIVSPIVMDGAGELYKASDTEKHRTVTIKPLGTTPANAEVRQRFERDVQTISSLNHPHICAVHEICREGDADFLVMEYLEGETLAARLERGLLPLDEALKIGISLVDALQRAHGVGVVHRNIRPTNIVLTKEGGAKLLEFGMARAEEPKPQDTASASEPRSKTTLADIPDEIVRYMSPEQIEGRDIDARSDIFSFGAVFYEMVTGEKAFEGRNRAMLVAAIASLDPYPLSKNQPDSPPMLDHVAQRCLTKDPDRRWQTSHDLLVQLRWVAEGGDVLLAASRARQRRERRVLAVIAAVLFLLTVTAAEFVGYWGNTGENEAFQFRVPVAGLSSPDISMSPDGKMLALVAKPNTQEANALYVRPTGATEFHRLVGTEDASQPFWSSDSRSIAFAAGGRLKRVDYTGGAPKDLGPAPDFKGGAWSAANVILFGSAKGLYRVSAEGGSSELVTAIEQQETGHFWPSFLPDGQHFLYLAWSADAAGRVVYAGKLGSKDKTKVMTADSNVQYAEPGYLLFHRDATLFAQPFDANKLSTTGDAFHIADQVEVTAVNGHGSFDVSQTGSVVYFQGGTQAGSGRGDLTPNYQWGWHDRTGQVLSAVAETDAFGDIDLSPDGKMIAVTKQDTTSLSDIWLIDWQQAGRTSRLTHDPGDDINPVWEQPSGKRVAFTTYRKGNADIYVTNANGTGDETPLLETAEDESIEAWSYDGKYIAYKKGLGPLADIWILPLTGDKKPFPFIQGAFTKDEPQFSFDGKWLAYTSNETAGTFQVYVVSFPDKEQKFTVSKDGGGQPRWRQDGKELFFRSPDDGSVWVANITWGPQAAAGVPQLLFPGPALGSTPSRNPVRHAFAVTPNGQQFLLRIPPRAGATRGGAGITVPFVTIQAAARGRGSTVQANQQNFVSAGLTVIQNYPVLKKGATP